MRVIPPVLIDDAKLTSSSAAEPHAPAAYSAGTIYAVGDIVQVAADFTIYESLVNTNLAHTPKSSPTYWRILGPTETAYNAGTTYALGDTVYSASTHRCYESLVAANLGNPLPVLPETTNTQWLDVGPTNKWAMLDLSRNTQTVHASPLTVVIAPGERINSIGLTGVKATSLTISATSVTGGGTVYGPVTFDLRTREVGDGYMYFFEPFSSKVSKVVFDVPPYTDIIVTITLSDTSGNVKCGAAVFGTYVNLGAAQYRGRSDGLNFSTITRDVWGNATLVQRRTVPKVNVVTIIDSVLVNRAMDARIALNAKACLWSGLDDTTSDWYEMFAILGVYKQFEIEAALMEKAQITLELEEI